jgi:hypothetical protein
MVGKFINHNKLVQDSVQIEGLETNWALQLGTMDNPNLIGSKIYKIEDYIIVHQYDRDPKLKELIINKYQ